MMPKIVELLLLALSASIFHVVTSSVVITDFENVGEQAYTAAKKFSSALRNTHPNNEMIPQLAALIKRDFTTLAKDHKATIKPLVEKLEQVGGDKIGIDEVLDTIVAISEMRLDGSNHSIKNKMQTDFEVLSDRIKNTVLNVSARFNNIDENLIDLLHAENNKLTDGINDYMGSVNGEWK